MGYDIIPVKIASGATSTAITTTAGPSGVYLDKGYIVAVYTPATWTASKVYFLASPDGNTEAGWAVVKDNTGTEVDLGNGTDTSAWYYQLPTTQVVWGPYVIIGSGTSSVPVSQTSTRTIYLVVRD